jgi:hypothetical protein
MSEEHKIKEGPPGTSSSPADNIIPPGAKRLPFSTRSYDFYFYRQNGTATIYIDITDYHPGILMVPLEKLISAIKYLTQE